MGAVYDDPDLELEREALHEMASILAKKWKGDLEAAECEYSCDGILTQYDTFWHDDYNALKTLANLHLKRVEAARKAKRERQEEQDDDPDWAMSKIYISNADGSGGAEWKLDQSQAEVREIATACQPAKMPCS